MISSTQVFPKGPNVATSAEQRKRDVDGTIMATVILDLQPINQVNRYVLGIGHH
jgi:hypothetical protein